jgi:hypothetical protein
MQREVVLLARKFYCNNCSLQFHVLVGSKCNIKASMNVFSEAVQLFLIIFGFRI